MKTTKLTYLLCGTTTLTALSACGLENKNSQKPDILIVVLDDLGFSDLQPFGGEINTPNINALSQQGKIFTRFHASPLSAPARSLLLTGVDNHRNGLGVMPTIHSTNQYMQPGYEGYLTNNVMTIAEILSQNNYYTCMSGKWHLGEGEHDPHNRGFQHSFALIGGGASHYANAFSLLDADIPITYYTENGEKIDKLPDDFYSSKNYADKMIEYIDNCPKSQPLFAYLTFTAAHDPLHVPEEWRDRYKGRYDMGYNSIREARYNRQLKSGIINPDAKLNYSSDSALNWDTLSSTQREEQIRRMEIYAAMIEYVDMSLGRVIDKLKSSGRYENTTIFLMSDNGANPHDAYLISGGTEEEFNKRYDNRLENYGAPTSYVSLGQSWAEVCNTPYSLYKYTTMEGGICTPFIVVGRGIEGGVLDNHNMLHATDILPTILEYAGCQRPTHRNGVELTELYGKSLSSVLSSPNTQHRGDDETICFEMAECKAVIKGDWKAVYLIKPYGDGEKWHLYNIATDIIEKDDLSKQFPDKLNELVNDWNNYANSVGYIKANGKSMVEEIGAERFYTYDPSLRME